MAPPRPGSWIRPDRIAVAVSLLFLAAAVTHLVLSKTGRLGRAVGPPSLTCDVPEHDFGAVPAGPLLEHAFVLANAGKAAVVISKVTPGCSCTDAKLDATTLPPGGSAVLRIKVDTSELRGPGEQTVLLESNDAARPFLSLKVREQVQSRFTVTPTRASFGTVLESAAASRTIEITSKGNTPFRVVGVVPGSEHIDVSVVPPAAGKLGPTRVTLSTVPPLPLGRIAGRVRLVTDDPQEVPIFIGFEGKVAGDYAVTPPAIRLPRVDGREFSRNVEIGPGRVKAFKIRTVEVPDPSVAVRIEEKGDSRFVVRVSGLRTDRPWSDKPIKIMTDAAEASIVLVPVVPGSQVPSTRAAVGSNGNGEKGT